MKQRLFQNIPTSSFAPFLIAIALILTFSSAILIPYTRADDYPFYLAAMSNPIALYSTYANIGRVLQGVISYWTYPAVPVIESYYLLRSVGLVGVIGLAVQLCGEFKAYRVTRKASAWLAYSLCVMPAFTYYVVSTAGAHVPFAVVLGVLSGQASKQVVLSKFRKTRLLFLVVSIVSFAMAGLIYEPAAMAFWLPAGAFLFSRHLSTRALLRRFAIQAAVFSAGGLAVYVIHILVGAHDPNRNVFPPSLLEKFVWFLGKPLENALNLFVVPSSPIVEWVVGLFILSGLWFYLRGSVAGRLVSLAVLLIMLPLSFLPHILSIHNWPILRTQVALTSLLVLYAYFALRGYMRLIRLRSGVIAKYTLVVAVPLFSLAAGFSAARNALVNVAIPNLFEFGFLKSQIANADLTDIDSIYVIRPHWEDGLAVEYVEEFGAMTSYWDWGAVPMTQVALREFGYNEADFAITAFGPDESVTAPPGTLVIDMRKINDLR